MSALEYEFDVEADIPTKGPSTGVDVRYHTKSEYNDLSPDEKEELSAIRTAARKVDKNFGKKPKPNTSNINKKKKSRKEKKLTREINALKATVAEQVDTIAAMRTNNSSTTSTENTNASNPLDRPTQRATVNGRAATVLFD